MKTEKKRCSSGSSGFTLITIVMAMAMIALLVTGLLSLVSGETATAYHESRLREARANALLGLETALGQLQKYAGPDKRITSEAGIFDENPETAMKEGVNHPHWVGVFPSGELVRVRRGYVEEPMIDRDGDGFYLYDKREANSRTPEDVVRTAYCWLVSGNADADIQDGEFMNPLDWDGTASPESPPVKLVGEGSVSEEHDHVIARRVDVESTGRRSAFAGGYAYWVGDEGGKAKLNVINHYAENEPDPSSPEDGGFFRILATQSNRIDWPELGFSEEEKEKLITMGQLKAQDQSGGREFAKEGFHDFTTRSLGVLSNVREGGLKQDLTAYLQSSGRIGDLVVDGNFLAPGIKDSDNMVGYPNEEASVRAGQRWDGYPFRYKSPRFGMLRTWAQMGDTIPVEGAELPPSLPKMWDFTADSRIAWGYDFTNQVQPDFNDQTQTSLLPILLEGSVYYAISHYEDPTNSDKVALRLHIYPRVALWNPYNVTIKARPYSVFLAVLGSQGLDLRLDDDSRELAHFFLPNSKDPTVIGNIDPTEGTLVFALEPIDIGPGECLLFSTKSGDDRSLPYSLNDVSENLLSAESFPGNKNFYLDNCIFKGGWDSGQGTLASYDDPPKGFKYQTSRAEDYRMILKLMPGNSLGSFTIHDMKVAPAAKSISVSYKGGANLNWHAVWNDAIEAPISDNQVQTPNYKTRDGYRLRWFQESDSNLLHWSPSRHFDSAPIANYNLHGTFVCRTPWDMLSWTEPEFFSIYNRDLWDDDISWGNLQPYPLPGAKWGTNPFAASQHWAQERYVLFDLPRKDIGIVSLGQFQHAKVSEFIWNPSFAIGNSFADIRAPRDKTNHPYDENDGGWNSTQYYPHSDYHALIFRSLAQIRTDREDRKPKHYDADGNYVLADEWDDHGNIVFDLSYELNHTLWDHYFLSTGDSGDKSAFAGDPYGNPLPNGRLIPNWFEQDVEDNFEEEINDFHRSASRLLIDGAFNVNSTSVEAWRALLTANRELGFNGSDSEGSTPFPRLLTPPGDGFDPGGGSSEGEETWNGYRSLSDDEIDKLAHAIVREVKIRAPFVSLADFVNRRLTSGETGLMGTLQAAIEYAGLNDAFDDYAIDREPLPRTGWQRGHPHAELHKIFQENKPPHKAAGAPGYLLQSDLLTPLAPSLTARSDTFVIRAYGDSTLDRTGEVLARAWCEAVVQRIPEPVSPDASGLNPATSKNDFGRRFRIISFRWLRSDEI